MKSYLSQPLHNGKEGKEDGVLATHSLYIHLLLLVINATFAIIHLRMREWHENAEEVSNN